MQRTTTTANSINDLAVSLKAQFATNQLIPKHEKSDLFCYFFDIHYENELLPATFYRKYCY